MAEGPEAELARTEAGVIAAMEQVRGMRRWTARLTLLLTAVCAGCALWYGVAVAVSVVLGGIAGVVGFSVLAKRVEELARSGRPAGTLFSLKGTLLRVLFYGGALVGGLMLDWPRLYGLIGATVGILLSRPAMVVAAFVGLKHEARGTGDGGKVAHGD